MVKKIVIIGGGHGGYPAALMLGLEIVSAQYGFYRKEVMWISN